MNGTFGSWGALLNVRDTVPRGTGAPARPFRQWVAENAATFR
jgi:hypothetical protein